METLNDLFLHHLQDIYYADKAALKALTKVAKAAESEELKQYVTHRRESGKEPIEKLEQVFETVGKRPRGKTCAAMNGLIEEIEEAINDGDKGPVLDAALIAGLQAVLHYDIARLGTLKAWARQTDNEEAEQVLEELLEQAKEHDEELTELAEGEVNEDAEEHEGEDEEGEEDEEEDEDEEEEDEEPEPEPEPEPQPAPKRGRKK